jgi:hypothetical protein
MRLTSASEYIQFEGHEGMILICFITRMNLCPCVSAILSRVLRNLLQRVLWPTQLFRFPANWPKFV